ncbi:hypothetical protein CHKEEEPN_3770 [Methylorubrum podarium]|nr:hypothetical protein CHKEEEPN_3770 [Methylorubrum podarium]
MSARAQAAARSNSTSGSGATAAAEVSTRLSQTETAPAARQRRRKASQRISSVRGIIAESDASAMARSLNGHVGEGAAKPASA